MKSLPSFIINETESIKDAMKKIDENTLQFVMVANLELKLLGTLTDGDIRRYLLSDKSINSNVTNAMNRNPIYAQTGFDKEIYLKIMDDNSIKSLPILNEKKQIVGLETSTKDFFYDDIENIAFIMAGGFGTRLGELTSKCPKPMLKISDKPILEHQINTLKKYGFKNYIISTHYLPDVIKEYFGSGKSHGVHIDYVYEKKPLGTGGALSLLKEYSIESPFLMMNGDILTEMNFANLLRFHRQNENTLTLCTKEESFEVPFGVVDSEQSRFLELREKPSFNYNINSGIYLIDKDIISLVEENAYLDMPTIINQAKSKNFKISTFPFNDYWVDIGSIADFERAKRDFGGF